MRWSLALFPFIACSLGVLLSGCPEEEVPPGPGDGAETGSSGETDAAVPNPLVTCENACKRAPQCEGALTTEPDCIASCRKATPYASSYEWACCVQFASGCAEVKDCLVGLGKCVETGDPWLRIRLFETCSCGDLPDDPGSLAGEELSAYKQKECKSQAPDHPCEPGTVCLKPIFSAKAPFCAIDCTKNASACKCANEPLACEQDLACESTPKTWYCKAGY